MTTGAIEAPVLYSKEEVAVALSVSVATVDKWIASKKISPIKVGRRCRIDQQTLDNLLSEKYPSNGKWNTV